MSDDAEIASNMSDLAKRSGLKSYLWLYFLIVPLAASTASAVAVVIAALQGLSQHELAAQIYAKTLIVGFKAIFIIAAAYMTGLVFALVSVALFSRKMSSLEERQRRTRQMLTEHRRRSEPSDDDEAPGDLGEYLLMMDDAVLIEAKRQQIMIGAAVLYSGVLMAVAYFWFLHADASELWSLIEKVANGRFVPSEENASSV